MPFRHKSLVSSRTLARRVLFGCILLAGCSGRDAQLAEPGAADFRAVALQFAKALAARDYSAAYGMTAQELRSRMSQGEMQAGFEAIVPLDWGPIDPIEVSGTLTEWRFPEKQPSDLGWVYVTIGGVAYGEAVIVIVTMENGEPRIRTVEFGRP